MAPFPFALVGFDLDGTLLDTSGDIAAAVNVVLAGLGRPPLGVAEVRQLIGGGSRHMLAQALADTGGCDEDLLDAELPRLNASYAHNIAVHTRPYPGVVAALDALRARGVRLAVVTNKLEHLARHVLDTTGLADRFGQVIGGDTSGAQPGKPSGAPLRALDPPGRAAFVGDSRYDIAAARDAGWPVIAVSFGYTPVPAREFGADCVIDHFDELLPALEGLA